VEHRVTFGLFGTLATATRPADPTVAVARELRERGVRVPNGFREAYGERQVPAPEHAEVPLPAHVAAALRACGVEPRGDPDGGGNAVRRAVVAAFDPEVTVRPGAHEAAAAASGHGPVAVLANCEVPEFARRTLLRAGLADAFDTVVTSAGCGWRKPHPEAFGTVARRLDVTPDALVYVGADPATDGGVEAVGGRFVDASERPLADLPAWFERTFGTY
jgi:FMN phosphatase YigB (HAD superfamily)